MKRDKLVRLQWSQSSEIMGGYSTPVSRLNAGDRTSDVYHEISIFTHELQGNSRLNVRAGVD